MKNIKIMEWNINKRSCSFPCKKFVSDRILEQEADIICLTEYTNDEGIKTSLKNLYWITESVCSQGNQILIAIKRSFSEKPPEVIRDYDEPECYNLLHLKVKSGSNTFSVVGIRMLTGDGKKAINAKKQTPPLNNYLRDLKDRKESFICVGDFNIREYRIKHWFPNYKIHEIQPSNSILEKTSFLFTNDDKEHKDFNNAGVLDHIISDESFEVSSKYNWDFLKDNEIYPTIDELKNGCEWDICPSYPDHGMLIADITFTDSEEEKHLTTNEHPQERA